MLLIAGDYEHVSPAVPCRGWVQHPPGQCSGPSGFTVLSTELPPSPTQQQVPLPGAGWVFAKTLGRESIPG